MNDQDFKLHVVGELAEIKTNFENSKTERAEIKKDVEELKTFVNKAKGGWIALGVFSAAISAGTAWIFKLFKHTS